MIGMTSVTSLYFFPQVLSAVVFSVFIATGHTLDLAMTYTVMTCLNILREPMRYFPYFIGQFVELLVSMKRLQEYMLCEQVNKGIVRRLDREEGVETAISIRKGYFFWGVEEGRSTNTSEKESA